MKNFVAGKWIDKAKKIEVRNPFDNSVIDTVPKADAGDLEKALAFAERGAKVMAKLSSYERWKILRKAADLMAARNEEFGQIISQEEGKIIAEGRGEASRAVETMMGSAEEAKRMHGETVPLDADPTGGKKLGFTLRVPCGVVAAIAPFNFPLNLVCHKVALRWPRVIRSSSSRLPTRRCRRSSSRKFCLKRACRRKGFNASPVPAARSATRWSPIVACVR